MIDKNPEFRYFWRTHILKFNPHGRRSMVQQSKSPPRPNSLRIHSRLDNQRLRNCFPQAEIREYGVCEVLKEAGVDDFFAYLVLQGTITIQRDVPTRRGTVTMVCRRVHAGMLLNDARLWGIDGREDVNDCFVVADPAEVLAINAGMVLELKTRRPQDYADWLARVAQAKTLQAQAFSSVIVANILALREAETAQRENDAALREAESRIRDLEQNIRRVPPRLSLPLPVRPSEQEHRLRESLEMATRELRQAQTFLAKKDHAISELRHVAATAAKDAFETILEGDERLAAAANQWWEFMVAMADRLGFEITPDMIEEYQAKRQNLNREDMEAKSERASNLLLRAYAVEDEAGPDSPRTHPYGVEFEGKRGDSK